MVQALNRMFFRPKGGMYRQFHAVKTYLEPKDVDLYRRLLPPPLEMPDRPVVMVFIADYTRVHSPLMPYYREGGISLQSMFRGQRGWLVLTLPVTNWTALWTGRLAGFPKYIPDELSLAGAGPGWCGRIRHRGAELLSLEVRPGAAGPLPAWREEPLAAQTFFTDDVHLIASPGRVRIVHFAHAVSPRTVVTMGTACVTIDPGEPWAGLFEQGATLPGAYCEFTGGVNLVTVPPRA